MTTDAPICSLCGAPIPDDAPRESWDWHPDPDSDDVEVLHAHPGCHRLRTDCLDVAEWHQGSIVDMLAEWIDGSESLARAAEEAAAGCEYAEAAVRSARRAHHIVRLRGEDSEEGQECGGWCLDGVDGYEPDVGADTTWDTADDAMKAMPGAWWQEEPGCWLCYVTDLDQGTIP